MRLFERADEARFVQKLQDDNLLSAVTLLVTDTMTGNPRDAICLSELTETLLDKRRPGVVVTPLVSGTFDAMDVAEALYCAGYTGELVVIASDLPRPHLVERELRESAPGLCVTLSVPGKANAPH